jgi:hypothetical protein
VKTTSSAVFGQIGYDMREGGLPFKVVVGGATPATKKRSTSTRGSRHSA